MNNKKVPRFDWMTLDPEEWRGPDLTFPLSAELVVVPEFNELVIAATKSFMYFDLVDPEEVNVRVLHDWERGENGPTPFNTMGESDLGLRLTYIEGDYQDYVLKLSLTKQQKEPLHRA